MGKVKVKVNVDLYSALSLSHLSGKRAAPPTSTEGYREFYVNLMSNVNVQPGWCGHKLSPLII